MGSGGHNVKSKIEHSAKGNYRPSRHDNRLEGKVKVLDTMPKPPASFDKRHADLWRICCKDLQDLGVLVSCDVRMLEMYVCHWFLWQDAIQDVRENGFSKTIETEKGVREIKNPAVLVMENAFKMVNQVADKFGFSPRARMGIKTDPQEEVDPFASFLNN